MANPAHLDVLSHGVVAWNDWRAANPDVVPDLSGADLSRPTNLKFSGADLSRALADGDELRLFVSQEVRSARSQPLWRAVPQLPP